MYELNPTELMSVHGGANHTDLEVVGLASAGASLSSALGYYMSYQTFSFSEALMFMAAGTIPVVIATGIVLGGIHAYHHLKG